MRAIRQLGFLRLGLRASEAPAEEDRRILALFRNRAELKKAYGELQDQIYRLKGPDQAAGRRHATRTGDAERPGGAPG